MDSDGGIWLYICEYACERPSGPETWDTRRYGHRTWLLGQLAHDELTALLRAVRGITAADVSAPAIRDHPALRWWAGFREPRRWPDLFRSRSSTLMLTGYGTASGKPRAVAACGVDFPAFQLDSAAARTVLATFRRASAHLPALDVCGSKNFRVEPIAPGVQAWWSRPRTDGD